MNMMAMTKVKVTEMANWTVSNKLLSLCSSTNCLTTMNRTKMTISSDVKTTQKIVGMTDKRNAVVENYSSSVKNARLSL